MANLSSGPRGSWVIPLKARVTGVDLMEHLIGRASKRGYRLYFLGARPAVVEAVVERAQRENPGVAIAGWRDGYWSPDEESRVVRAIADARPDILFVAIGSPSKEQFIARWKDTIAAPFLMGVGGSFDIYAGTTKCAPGWVQRIGFEWLFRLSQEPQAPLAALSRGCPCLSAPGHPGAQIREAPAIVTAINGFRGHPPARTHREVSRFGRPCRRHGGGRHRTVAEHAAHRHHHQVRL